MLVINQGASGYIYPTLKEKSLIENPYYLIKFVQDTGKQTRYTACSDISDYPARYQKLLITETNTPNPYRGDVKLDHVGDWKYFIYEVEDIGIIVDFALVDYDAITLLEQGRLKVVGTTTARAKYTGYQASYEEHKT